MNNRGKKSTIVITIFLAIVTIFAVYLYLLDVKEFKELFNAAKDGAEDIHHVAETVAVVFIAWFGVIAIIFVIGLILIVVTPSLILLIFTIRNIKSDLKWVKILNIIYTIVLASYVVLSIVKTVMLFVY